ncbi:MAG: cyclase family protein [Bryobacteraceae bacterium]|nr:cyclase family protein [Bryobacteraceae bacterium]
MVSELLQALGRARVYDLAQPYFVGMPHHPIHPPFLYSLLKKHGDFVSPACGSSAAESIALGAHVGTHVDALCHFSKDGKLHDGSIAAEVQSYGRGVERLGVDTIRPLIARGVLLDIAALMELPVLPVDFLVTPQHMEDACGRQKVDVRAGDIVLLRTGWATYWDDAAAYIAQVRGPGPELEGARWLSSKGVIAAGSDTVAFERVPSANMPVHLHLLVEQGIHIIEALNMEELSRDGVHEFVFVAAPLKLKGGTGSPIRPLALV